MDFAVDENLLLEAKDKCETTATEIEGYIDTIYGTIADLNKCWSGSSYNEFSNSCSKYRESLDQLVNLLRAYAVLLNGVNVPRAELEEKIKNAISS